MISKCVVHDGKFVEPCDKLHSVTESRRPSGKMKGVFIWDFEDIKSGRKTRAMFGAKSGDHINGLLFNFCPYCGEQIDAPFVND